MKRPSFQFYPADWRKDPALSTCSLPARGLWIELMCIAHESEEYGVLSIGGKAMTTQQIARAVGESPAMVAKLLDELGDARVFSRDDKGSIFSRRMVKDERIRNVRAEAGRLGGNPDLLGKKVKQKDKQNEEQNLTPSSSSSSSSSEALSSSQSDQAEGASGKLGFAPSKAGEVGMALKRAGVSPDQINLSDPRLAALISQGATPEEFEGIAREAITNRISKPVPWVLVTLQNRREEAAAIALPQVQQADPMAWAINRRGVINRACELGIGPWDESNAAAGTGPSWVEYRAEVIAADAAQRQGVAA